MFLSDNIDKLLLTSDTNEFKSSRFELSGFDVNTLSSLIKQVIDGNKDQQESLAKILIDKLTTKGNKETVNTLFAVEAINMLSDDKFYKENMKLIINNSLDSKIPMKFNPNISDFSNSLDSTLKALESNYDKAFKHPSNENFSQNFNLMAYAILEERLNILKIYFAEHGNTAVNTLLFSSLLGAPFNSNIVESVLNELSITEEPLLKSLREYIKKDTETTTLSIEHYEIIDQVYEILSRYSAFKNAYVYRHSLLNIFLDKQLDYTIDSIFLENKMKSKNILFTLIVNNIITNEQKESPLILKKDLFSNLEFYIMVISTVLSKVIMNGINISNSEKLYDWFIPLYDKLYSNGSFLVLNKSLPQIVQIIENEYPNYDKGKEKYFELLWKGVSINNRLFNQDAIKYSEKMYAFINKLEKSTENSILKGEFYYKIGGYKYLHVNYSEGLKELFLSVKSLKQAMRSDSINSLTYDKVNITLSYVYGRIGELLQRNSKDLEETNKKNRRLERALNYHLQALKINKEIEHKYPENNEYLRKLGVVYERIGQTYRELKQNKNAENNLLKAMKIKKTFYDKTTEGFSYRKILIILFDFYEKIDNIKAKECIQLAEETIAEKEYLHDVKNLNQYHIESYLKTYTRVFKFNPNNNIKERIDFLNSILKSRGLNAEY